ncbi:hypothetical protein GOODEAATRI_015691 [Goodea atripinnis]|uniref:TIR domain-containing protein n=1 Tax=Goodea atripinnis TaxID=208336 RepID=A0ABV0P4L7_9TELE
MRHLTTCSLTLLLASLIRGQMLNGDEGRPSCSRCDLHLSCNCSYSGFTSIPMVTDQALSLDLSFNNITMVTQDDLMGLSRLRALDLHGNRLAVIHPSAFDPLWSLEELDLSDNQLTTLNHKWFSKLEVLQQLNLLDNPYSRLSSPSLFYGLVRLRRLMFGGSDLKELRTGDLLGVTELDELTVHANNLARYDSGTLGDIWPLGHVTLSLHGPFLTNVTLAAAVLADISYPETQITLEDLHLVGNQHLSFRNFSVSDQSIVDLLVVIDGVPISVISMEDVTLTDLHSYKRLENLQAGYNKYVCGCDFVNFLQSQLKGGGDVKLTDREDSYACDSPLHLRGEAVSQVHLSVVVCHPVLFISVSCGVALLIGVLICVLLWRLHAFWYLKMTWAWLKAKRSSQKPRKDILESEVLQSFDAFVSYSERDAGWVENFLVPELEEPREDGSTSPGSSRPLSLCLHKRDFLPGHWIMDNIMSAIEHSRHTVFILSENFLQSDWCRYELDFSHFWLFDAGGDAAILILLEPLPKDNIPKRFCKLRKLMSSTTYLEWPQEEERRPEFWRSLRNALRGDDD